MTKVSKKYQLIYEVEVEDPRHMARVAVEIYSNASFAPVKIYKIPADDKPKIEIPFNIITFMEYGIHKNYKNEEEFINVCITEQRKEVNNG